MTYMDNCGNSRANTCTNGSLTKSLRLLVSCNQPRVKDSSTNTRIMVKHGNHEC